MYPLYILTHVSGLHPPFLEFITNTLSLPRNAPNQIFLQTKASQGTKRRELCNDLGVYVRKTSIFKTLFSTADLSCTKSYPYVE